MKLLILALCLGSAPAWAASKKCVCTCVVLDDGKFTTLTGQGTSRVAAGESLKKALGKDKRCEVSPDCSGNGCKMDAD